MVGGSESEDSDESASSDDERAARLGCTKRTRSARARRYTVCLALGQQAAVKKVRQRYRQRVQSRMRYVSKWTMLVLDR